MRRWKLRAAQALVAYDVPRDGGVVNGSFSVTFQRCVDFGCGRTVFGDFKATVQ